MSRADRLWEAAAAEGLDQLIVADLVNPGDSGREAGADVFWLTGFTGTSGFCLLAPDLRLFLTDVRYTERAAREVDPSFERVTAGAKPLSDLAGRLHGRVGYDDARTSVRTLRRLEEETSEDVELVAVEGLLGRMRRRKDAEEVRRIAAAAALADEVYGWLREQGLVGRTEREVAFALEHEMRRRGATDPSFPSIVASGPRGALPHASPADELIERGTLVTLDMGVILDGYCSDCTRTWASISLPAGPGRTASSAAICARSVSA